MDEILKRYKFLVFVMFFAVVILIVLGVLDRFGYLENLASNDLYLKLTGGNNVVENIPNKSDVLDESMRNKYMSGINVLPEDEIMNEGVAEVVFIGKVLDSIYIDDGLNKIDIVPKDLERQISLVLNDSTAEAFPLTMIDEKGNISSKSTKFSTIKRYLSEVDEVQIKCNIMEPDFFVDNCNHDKCSLWTDKVKAYRQSWENYIETGLWPEELGFCVSIDIELK